MCAARTGASGAPPAGAVNGSAVNMVVYILRRDLRVADNPILHHLSTAQHGFTHLLPVYVVPAHQVEVSGFLRDGEKSPYPGKFWRCGPARARFLAQSVWDLKRSLEGLGSGLLIRVGRFEHVVGDLLDGLRESDLKVGTVWMTEEVPTEEVADKEAVAEVCSACDVEFKTWPDEKYFIDDRDLTLKSPSDVHDVFTDFRKSQEPLRERPRAVLPTPSRSTLPTFPITAPPQSAPFDMPSSYHEFEHRLLDPIQHLIRNPPAMPPNAISAHPFEGGETSGLSRLQHVVARGCATRYNDTRNGLMGCDFSTKLSAWLALGCLTARQVHASMVRLEDGTDATFKNAAGYGKGENDGTAAVRFELMWRDYMRLCARKAGKRLFRLRGFGKPNRDRRYYDGRRHGQHGQHGGKWKSADRALAPPGQMEPPEEIGRTLDRFLNGTTGMGLIDASQRELFLTGYTSNRARQNVANFLSKHLGIDWRYGAEWYESLLVDYDASSNWCNWQYVAGVGNDPRGHERIFNPVKQAFEYDSGGHYVRMWVPELRQLERLENVFQAWTTPRDEWVVSGLAGLELVEQPVKKISFFMGRHNKSGKRGDGRGINGRGVGNGRNGSIGNGISYTRAPIAHGNNNGSSGGGDMPPAAHGNNNTNVNVNGKSNNNIISRGPRGTFPMHTGYARGHSSRGPIPVPVPVPVPVPGPMNHPPVGFSPMGAFSMGSPPQGTYPASPWGFNGGPGGPGGGGGGGPGFGHFTHVPMEGLVRMGRGYRGGGNGGGGGYRWNGHGHGHGARGGYAHGRGTNATWFDR